MAKTIPQLTDATTVNAADELIIQQGGITKRATGAELAKGLNTINGTVNVKDFGAVGDGVANDTAAIQAAFNASNVVYLPKGTYRVTDKITLPNHAVLYGTDRHNSSIRVGADFNMSATGVFAVSAVHEPGPDFRDFEILFEQDTSNNVRANVRQYPPAVDLYTVRAGRNKFSRLRITNAWVGLDLRGNNGGTNIQDLEISAFHKGVIFDGALDIVYMSDFHFWPFGCSGTPLESVFADGNTIAGELKNIDGLHAESLFTLFGKFIVDGGFGMINTVMLDSNYANIEFKNGAIYAVGAMYCSTGAVDDFAIRVNGTETRVAVAAMWLINNADMPTGGLVQITSATAELIIGNFHVRTSGDNTSFVYMTDGSLLLDNGFLEPPVGNLFGGRAADQRAFINVLGGRLSLTQVRVRDKGGGTGLLIEASASPDRHTVSDLTAPGWTVSFASNTTDSNFSNNTVATTNAGSRRVCATKEFDYSGTLDGSGEAVFAHNLGVGAGNRFLVVQAWEADGPWYPLDIDYIDGVNIGVSGGTASATYRATIQARIPS